MVTRTEEEEEEERCATKMLLSCQHCRLSPKIFLLWQYLKIFRKNSMLRGSHFSWLMELEDSLMSSSMFCFASRVCLCLSTSSIRKYTRHKEKYEPSLGLLPVCLFFFPSKFKPWIWPRRPSCNFSVDSRRWHVDTFTFLLFAHTPPPRYPTAMI